MTFPGLISPSSLATLLASDTPPTVLDASWHMPATGRNAHQEYLAAHIPGALFFNIDTLSDTASPLPHMLPTAESFAQSMSALGISNDHTLVIYDSHGLFSAARAWWMFRTFGHTHVFILDGGLPQWQKEKRPLDRTLPQRTPTTYTATLTPGWCIGKPATLEALRTHSHTILDARSPSRFHGMEREPRVDLRAGHIPGSTNLHYRSVLDTNGTLLSPEKLQTLLDSHGISKDTPCITSCGSGVTAAILSFVLEGLGYTHSLYDGSWAEWGQLTPWDGIPTPVDHSLSRITGFTLPDLVTQEVTFTALSMDRPLGQPALQPPRGGIELHRLKNLTPFYYRFLYLMVGRHWHWTERLLLDDDAIHAILADTRREFFVLEREHVPIGLFELDHTTSDTVKIPYIGLRHDQIGKGLGRYLIRQALIEAWRFAPDHVTLHTTSQNHPNSLPLLQNEGFHILRQTQEKSLMFVE